MLMRTAAADPILDEMRWKSYMALSNEIIVIPSEKMNREISSDIPITILEVENYLISNNYYESKDVLNFYNQTILYVNQYKSGLRNVKGALEEIALLIEDELKNKILLNMPRPKGVPNKITSEVKEKLQLLIDELIESLEINKLDTNQRIKMLQIALQYTLPRLQSMVVRDEVELDLPLFVE